MSVKLNILKKDAITEKIPEMYNKLYELTDKKILVVILICLAAFVLDFIFVIGWQNNRLKTVKPKIKQIKADIDTINKNFSCIDELKKKYILDKKDILSEGQFSILLEEISNIANKNNALIMRIKPVADSKDKDPKAKKSLKDKKQKAVLTEKFIPAFIDMELSCGYHNLGNFINSLENSTNFMQIQNIKISTNQEDYSLHKVTLLIKTFIKK